MVAIRKKILRDEDNHVVAVQIDHQDWLEIERLPDLREEKTLHTDLSKFRRTLTLTEDPVEYQRRIRDEWGRDLDWDARLKK